MYRFAVVFLLLGTPAHAACPETARPGDCPDPAVETGWVKRDSADGPVWQRFLPDGTVEKRAARSASVEARFEDDARRAVGPNGTGETSPPLSAGDVLPSGYYIMTGADRLGLPPAQDGWVYFDVEDHIYRVMLDSREIVELVER